MRGATRSISEKREKKKSRERHKRDQDEGPKGQWGRSDSIPPALYRLFV